MIRRGRNHHLKRIKNLFVIYVFRLNIFFFNRPPKSLDKNNTVDKNINNNNRALRRNKSLERHGTRHGMM